VPAEGNDALVEIPEVAVSEVAYKHSEEVAYRHSEEVAYRHSEEVAHRHSEEVAYKHSEEVAYKHSEYVPPPKELTFVEARRNAEVPVPPEPIAPPKGRSPRCPTSWCFVIAGGIATTMIGFAVIMTLADLWAGLAVGGAGIVMGIGGFIGHLVANAKVPGD
jgi:hypothetical protein